MNSLNNDCISLINEIINIETKYKIYFVLGKTFNWDIEDILKYNRYIEIKNKLKNRYYFLVDEVNVYDLIPNLKKYNTITFKYNFNIPPDQAKVFLNNKFEIYIGKLPKLNINDLYYQYFDGNNNEYHYFVLKSKI